MPEVDAPQGSHQSGVRNLGLAMRDLQDRVTATSAPDDVANAAANAIQEICATLEPHRYIAARDKGWSDTQRGAGSKTLNPVFRNVELNGNVFQATIRFTTFHLGANGAAHGGAIPMVFDEALGKLANYDQSICRTAYLKVDYRNVTPLDVELQVRAHIEKIDGRKRFLQAAIYNDGVLTAEATALFIELKEGAA